MNVNPPDCLVPRGEGVLLRVAVVPNARRTEADGLHDGVLRVRLHALPIEGRANDELVAWLARELDLPRRAVRLAQGASARRKSLEIDAPFELVRDWLDRQLG